MAKNRHVRRAEASVARSQGSAEGANGSNGNVAVTLSASQKNKIAAVQTEVAMLQRRLGQLDLEMETVRAVLRQKMRTLETVCANALREHGIDLEDPTAGRWDINPETMDVQHRAAG